MSQAKILKIDYSNKFKEDYKDAIKQHKKIEKLHFVINELRLGHTLPIKYHDHKLTSSKNFYQGERECHIEPNWLLVYRYSDDRLILILCRTGSHSELF